MKILFIHQGAQSFVKKDLDILREKHEVRELKFSGKKGLFLNLLPDLWELLLGVIWCDITFSWFGKLHAFFAVILSRILGRKSVVVAGGDDAAMQTMIGRPYGIFSHPVKGWFGKIIFRLANRVIAISEYNYQEIIANTPVLPEKVKMIYHGFDPALFFHGEEIDKENIVITVGSIDAENYWRKGYFLIKEVARSFPKIPFYIIGLHDGDTIRKLERDKPDNLFFPGPFYGEELVAMLSRAKVYLQLSEWESFGCALAEAMLCECVPVVYRGTALPEVVGDCGYYVDSFDPDKIAVQIKAALKDEDLGKKARERIVSHFPLQKRRDLLLKTINDLMGAKEK